MKKPDIAKKIARQNGVTQAEAADHLDRLVEHILANFRKGRETKLPGLGKFTIDPERGLSFQPMERKPND